MTYERGSADILRGIPRMLFSTTDTADLVRNRLQGSSKPPDLIVSIGKASREMLAGASSGATGKPPCPVICVSPAGRKSRVSGHDGPNVTSFQAGHPWPDEVSFSAARYTLDAAERMEPGSHLLALISGGASALFELPLPPLGRSDSISAYMFLVGSGRPIGELNTVRRHLSSVKGGNLLRRLLERDVTVDVLAVSDVLGDQPHDIGSGPFSPDPTTFADALAIASRIDGFPVSALSVLRDGAAGHHRETLKPGSFADGNYRFHCIASPEKTVERLVEAMNRSGERAQSLPVPMNGARDTWINTIYQHILSNRSELQGCWLAAYGELEVMIPGTCRPGRGGRATSLVLEMALEAKQRSLFIDIAVLATDGADGNSSSGGGFLTAEDIAAVPADAFEHAIHAFDAAAWLEKRDRLYDGAPTGTNLGDILLLRLRPPTASR